MTTSARTNHARTLSKSTSAHHGYQSIHQPVLTMDEQCSNKLALTMGANDSTELALTIGEKLPNIFFLFKDNQQSYQLVFTMVSNV